MGELEPCPREGIGELVRVLQEAPRDLFVRRVEAQRQVGGEHRRHQLPRCIVGVRDRWLRALGHPLVRPGRALREFPLEAEQVLEVVVAPLRGRLGPGDLQPAGDGIGALARAEPVLPAEALRLEASCLRFHADIAGGSGTMGLAEAVATGDQGDGFLVVHGHSRKRLADVAGCGERVRIAFGAFRVHVDQAHLHRGERIFEASRTRVVARMAFFAAEPPGFAAPVHIHVRFPGVLSATCEAKGLEAHGFHRDIAGEQHQVRPRNGPAVFLLDRPQQAARLVQVAVVRPAVERCESLLAATTAAAAVADAVGARAVPGQAHHQATVVAEVGRPPVLRIGHQRSKVGLERDVVERGELLRVVEASPHRVGLRGVLVQQVQAQLVRPPVAVGGPGGIAVERALRFGRHGGLLVMAYASLHRSPRCVAVEIE